MNVLMFVVTMLMLLTIMTYARLETYRNSQVFRILFENYMEKDERGYINMAALKAYDTTLGSSKKGGKPSAPKVQASPRISLALLLNKTKREGSPQNAASIAILLKNLAAVLYSEQPFYQKMLNERPLFMDDLISALMLATAEKPIKNAVDLANLKLDDEELNEVFYKMLKGAPYKEIDPAAPEPLPPQEEAQGNDDAGDETSIAQEAKEHRSPKGYFSLLDFITMQNVDKVRVYLASREVLKAIYGDDALVNDVINKRNEFYHQIYLEDGQGVQSLSESFKNEFNHRQDHAVVDDVLDFTLSKTNPKKYE